MLLENLFRIFQALFKLPIQRFEQTHTISRLESLSNQFHLQNEPSSSLEMVPSNDETKSRWEAMRLKKHFTIQTNILLKPNEPTYVGAFSASTELKTVKKSPFAYLPLLGQLFERDEFMLVKSAILVFITAKYEKIQPIQTEQN